MPAWSEIVKAQGKEELNKLKYHQKMITSEFKQRELDIKSRLDKIDYLSNLGINAEQVLGQGNPQEVRPVPEQSDQPNTVTTPTNTPYIG